MGKFIYTINAQGYVAVIEKASYSSNIGVVNSTDPLVLCMRDDLLRYYPASSPEDFLTINVSASIESHVAANLMDSTILSLLPA